MGLVLVVPWAYAFFGDRLPAQLTVTPIFLSMSVSVGVGVFFGLYPALRASRLDPIEALRHD
jgi:putative ABC transport system permease protein